MFNNRGAYFITEQGLYDLINGSKMEKAVKFRKWVVEMITTFRKTGKYTMKDFKKSKYGKTLKDLPGYEEDPVFKHYCTIQTQNISKTQGLLIGAVWNKINTIFFEHFKINLLREISKFTKKNKLTRRPNTREYLDIAGYHTQTYIAFEILRHDEQMKTNPEKLAYIIAMCQDYFAKLNSDEKAEIKKVICKMFNDGILTPGPDYEAISEYKEIEKGVKSVVIFKD